MKNNIVDINLNRKREVLWKCSGLIKYQFLQYFARWVEVCIEVLSWFSPERRDQYLSGGNIFLISDEKDWYIRLNRFFEAMTQKMDKVVNFQITDFQESNE
jgi:hypothetical protein